VAAGPPLEGSIGVRLKSRTQKTQIYSNKIANIWSAEILNGSKLVLNHLKFLPTPQLTKQKLHYRDDRHNSAITIQNNILEIKKDGN